MGRAYERFKKRHLFQPDIDGPDYFEWNRGQWNSWLISRNSYRDTCFNLPSEKITVLIIAEESLKFLYRNPLSFNDDPLTMLAWSKNGIDSFVFKLNKDKSADEELYYDVYYCGSMYILALCDSSYQPIHIKGHDYEFKNDNLLEFSEEWRQIKD